MVMTLAAVIGDDDPAEIWFELPYQGKVTGQVLQSFTSVQCPTPQQKTVLLAKRFPFKELEMKLSHFFG